MSFYRSPGFFDVVTSVYHQGRATEVRDVACGGRVFRLLFADGQPALPQVFLDYHEPLGALDHPDPDGGIEWLEGAVHAVVDRGTYLQDWQVLDETPEEAKELGKRLAPHGEPFLAAPTTRLDQFADFDAFLAELRERSSKVKDDVRLYKRLGKDIAEPVFTVDDHADDVLPFAFEHKSRQMLETLGFDLYADERNRNFFFALREANLLKASTLRAGDRLVAVWLGAIHDGSWLGGWIFTHDPSDDIKRYSVGRQLVYRMIEEAFARGLVEFDFSIGDQVYKWYFATHARAVAPMGTPPARVRLKRRVKAALRQRPALEARARSLLERARALRP